MINIWSFPFADIYFSFSCFLCHTDTTILGSPDGFDVLVTEFHQDSFVTKALPFLRQNPGSWCLGLELGFHAPRLVTNLKLRICPFSVPPPAPRIRSMCPRPAEAGEPWAGSESRRCRWKNRRPGAACESRCRGPGERLSEDSATPPGQSHLTTHKHVLLGIIYRTLCIMTKNFTFSKLSKFWNFRIVRNSQLSIIRLCNVRKKNVKNQEGKNLQKVGLQGRAKSSY